MSGSSIPGLGLSLPAPRAAPVSACSRVPGPRWVPSHAAERTSPPAAGRQDRATPAAVTVSALGLMRPWSAPGTAYGYDGELNCCTYEGNRCGFDAACCGLASCIGGFCSSAGSASAGSGGFASANAQGGTVSIGDINSGGNVGNTISVGNTQGGRAGLRWHRLQHDGRLGVCKRRHGDRGCQWWLRQCRWRWLYRAHLCGSGRSLLGRRPMRGGGCRAQLRLQQLHR